MVPLPPLVEAIKDVPAVPEGDKVILFEVNEPSVDGEAEKAIVPVLGMPASPKSTFASMAFVVSPQQVRFVPLSGSVKYAQVTRCVTFTVKS